MGFNKALHTWTDHVEPRVRCLALGHKNTVEFKPLTSRSRETFGESHLGSVVGGGGGGGAVQADGW